MRKASSIVGVAAALITTSFIAAPATAAALPCVDGGSVASYIALGSTGCTVGPFLFNNISVTPSTNGANGSSVSLTSFHVLNPGTDNEFGLALNYAAAALNGTTTGGSADVSWIYNVSGIGGTLIGDALLALTASDVGSGQSFVTETLIPGGVLSLNGSGSTSTTFNPAIPSILVMKDQSNVTGILPGTATASIVTNAFSPVPGPIVGAGLPGLIAACGGLIGLARRRRRQQLA